MKIGITQRIIINEHGARLDALEQSYINYYSSFGVSLIPIPNTIGNLKKYINDFGIERIILSGGGNVHPKLYNGSVLSGDIYSEDRNRTEAALLKYAIHKNIPVLGQCRGAEFINVFFGGKLIQNIKKEIKGGINHIDTNHKIKISGNLFGKKLSMRSATVNSFHRDGLTEKGLAPELKVFAKSGDGIIEGFYHPQKPIIGIMWHPERPRNGNNKISEKIFDIFMSN